MNRLLSLKNSQLEHIYELLIRYVQPRAVEELETDELIEWSEHVGLKDYLHAEGV